MEMAGPAPGRPKVPTAWLPPMSKSRTGAFKIDGTSNLSPAAAVPVRVKMPEPTTTPIPRAIRLPSPRDFFRR